MIRFNTEHIGTAEFWRKEGDLLVRFTIKKVYSDIDEQFEQQ